MQGQRYWNWPDAKKFSEEEKYSNGVVTLVKKFLISSSEIVAVPGYYLKTPNIFILVAV